MVTNPKFTAALYSSMRIQQRLMECGMIGKASPINNEITIKQFKDDLNCIATYIDEMERKLAKNPSTNWQGI